LARRPLGVRERAALGDNAPDTGRGAPETGREMTPEPGRERDVEDVRDKPEARREIAGEGGAGREEVRDVTDCVLRRWFHEGGCGDSLGSSGS
jgi:hypothetical protein